MTGQGPYAAPTPPARRLTAAELAARKGQEPLVCLTAYTAWTARLLEPHADVLLVGDSLGMVVYGLPSTVGVTLDMMVAHGRAVVAATTRPFVLVDLPFGAYEAGPSQAFESAARVMAETGASGVKLEGGVHMAETVSFLTQRGIPVMAHIGLTPQSVNTLGGFRARGRDEAEADRFVEAAKALEGAGAFSVLIEATLEPVARRVHEALSVSTIGIGASPACDGQILVTEDLLGLTGGRLPKFVKQYADLGSAVSEAASDYAADVRARRFPGPDQLYK